MSNSLSDCVPSKTIFFLSFLKIFWHKAPKRSACQLRSIFEVPGWMVINSSFSSISIFNKASWRDISSSGLRTEENIVSGASNLSGANILKKYSTRYWFFFKYVVVNMGQVRNILLPSVEYPSLCFVPVKLKRNADSKELGKTTPTSNWYFFKLSANFMRFQIVDSESEGKGTTLLIAGWPKSNSLEGGFTTAVICILG